MTTQTTESTDKVEEIRRREVGEGNLFDCPHRYYAALVVLGSQKMCGGNRVGVGGIGLSVICSTCPNYAQTPHSRMNQTQVEVARRLGKREPYSEVAQTPPPATEPKRVNIGEADDSTGWL